MDDNALAKLKPTELSVLGARAYDVFCTANFFSFVPWAASIEYLVGCGIELIQEYNMKLVKRFIGGMSERSYRLISPRCPNSWSTLIVFSHIQRNRNPEILKLAEQGNVDIAKRLGNLRISPHLYNTDQDIDRLLSILNSVD
jgi:selenocysteine lyase/cysteine desulfurase